VYDQKIGRDIKVKKILGTLAALTIAGCASNSNTPVHGPYLQVIFEGQPIYEISYSSEPECKQAADLEINIFDETTRRQFASGKIKVFCAKTSIKDNLPNKAVIVEIATGKKNEARFISAGWCMTALANMKSKAHMIYCGW
jgi:hypothetical protein